MTQNKIIPSLWFCADGGKLAQVVDYRRVFGNELVVSNIIPLGDTPSGYSEMCEVEIFGQKYSWLCTEQEHHKFNDALSLSINCKGQKEIDKYWDYFTQDGQEVQCGWCIDKYGLRWQVIPANFGELMSKPNSLQVMMSQKKIIIADYLK